MQPHYLQQKLELGSNKRLKLRINDNASTMLSVKWEAHCTKVSLHRMFLEAPLNVMNSLACYIRREEKVMPLTVKFFIEENIKHLNYSQQVDNEKLMTQGAVYNLKKIYDDINQEYFKNKLDLLITWFGKPNQRARTKVTFGLYHDPLRLIKIHRFLDNPSVPDYLISYVIYHEMLHHVCPAYRDEKGLNRIHSKEFKEKEKQFKYFELAKAWIKEHQGHLFRGTF